MDRKSTRRAELPNFWGGNKKYISDELKDMIYSQYYSHDTLYIYVDGGCKDRSMSVACSYVQKMSINVKSKFIQPPNTFVGNSMYCELEAIIFALNHYHEYLQNDCCQVVIYSDVSDIKKFIANELTFRKKSGLREVQREMMQLFQIKKEQSGIPIIIEYLTVDQKRHNPFAISSHKAANKLVKSGGNGLRIEKIEYFERGVDEMESQ